MKESSTSYINTNPNLTYTPYTPYTTYYSNLPSQNVIYTTADGTLYTYVPCTPTGTESLPNYKTIELPNNERVLNNILVKKRTCTGKVCCKFFICINIFIVYIIAVGVVWWLM